MKNIRTRSFREMKLSIRRLLKITVSKNDAIIVNTYLAELLRTCSGGMIELSGHAMVFLQE